MGSPAASCAEMNWVMCTAEDRLSELLKGILRSTPDPVKFNQPGEQIAVKRILTLESKAKQQ